MNRTLKKCLERERRARKSGDWGDWEFVPGPAPERSGWLSEVTEVWKNRVFAVLVRHVPTLWGEVTHAAIRNVSETPITWAEMQRIKEDLFGTESTGVEVYPPRAELVDEANMYHLWILPEGVKLPFTLITGGHRRGMTGGAR